MAANNGKEVRKLREMLSQRQMLGMMGTTALGTLVAGCEAGAIGQPQSGATTAAGGGTTVLAPSCVPAPEVTEGP